MNLTWKVYPMNRYRGQGFLFQSLSDWVRKAGIQTGRQEANVKQSEGGEKKGDSVCDHAKFPTNETKIINGEISEW